VKAKCPMSRRSRKPDCQKPEIEASSLRLPAGTPAWITPELVELTLKTWQPYYKEPLTIDEAIGMIRSAGLMFDAL